MSRPLSMASKQVSFNVGQRRPTSELAPSLKVSVARVMPCDRRVTIGAGVIGGLIRKGTFLPLSKLRSIVTGSSRTQVAQCRPLASMGGSPSQILVKRYDRGDELSGRERIRQVEMSGSSTEGAVKSLVGDTGA